MLRCIATICVNGTLRTKLRAIADAGFEHVEIFESDLLASPEPVAVVGAMMRDQVHAGDDQCVRRAGAPGVRAEPGNRPA